MFAYYWGMKPHEFWNCRYSEIKKYCQANLARKNDDLIDAINLQEATTNKLLAGDCMNQKAKIMLIRDCYKSLFNEENQLQSAEEITRRMRGIMRTEKNKKI